MVFIRRAIITLAVIVIGVAVAFTTYFLFNNYESVISYDDFIYDEISIDNDGVFHGRFQIVDKTRRICGYSHEIKDGVLYLSLNATAGTKEVLETDGDGYIDVEFQAEVFIEKIVYVCGSEETELDWFRD